ncbi:uncharacterized protein LOC121736632 [Aricia agestis]|uniref:uncharacterized protein LOC121736632 n=1 Tax=Aricia agestis TaxID=91739 RepID=UPI001C206801|nr:uncharacterized protein LOC121736632 [Aricia agestis]
MDKNKMGPPSIVIKTKRPTISAASTKRPTLQSKEKINRTKVNKNNTVVSSADITVCKSEDALPNFDAEYREIAYVKFLHAMLGDCLVDEKISREETLMDVQMSQLADRFQKTVDQLDKTKKKLNDISFVVEQKRLLDLKSKDCSSFYKFTEDSQVEGLLKNLSVAEQAKLDNLVTKNIDFGYTKESGYEQLLDAVNETIEGLEQIKKHSQLDINKLKEYEKTQKSIEELEKERCDLENLKKEIESDLPKFSEKLLMEASEKITKMINTDDDDDDTPEEDTVLT